MEKAGIPSEERFYVFNGDYVDRGAWGLKTFLILLAWKVAMLKKELASTNNALDESKTKLKSKEKLATTTMAAHEAAGFRERIEELTRQVEEEAEHGKKEHTGVRKTMRHMYWPWQAPTTTPNSDVGSLVQNRRRRSLPELEALLHFRI